MSLLNDSQRAIEHLANAYLAINEIRAESDNHDIQLASSVALVSISEAQKQAFEIRAILETEE